MPEAESQSHLHLKVRHRAGSLHLAVKFELERPWTVLFGPSGSGKTMTLRMIAGLIAPQSGSITRIDFPGSSAEKAVVFDSSKDGIHVEPHRRGIGFAPQHPSIFPHLSVRENLAFGLLDGAKTHPEETNATLAPIVELLRISDLLTKQPGELSGGEAQRVNLARACVTAMRPAPNASRILLLDEPLTGFDLRLRDEIVAGLKSWAEKHRLLVLSVTHEIGEVFQLGAEVLRLRDGAIVERGPAQQVLGEERARLLRQIQAS